MMSCAVMIVAAAIAACFVCAVGIKVGRRLFLTSKIPGPFLWDTLTRHAKHLLSEDTATYGYKLCVSYNYKPWGTWISFFQYVLIISDCESICAVYKSSTTRDKPDLVYKLMSRILGNNLLTMNGPEYARHRKVFGAGLRRSLQKHFVGRLHKTMLEFVEALREEAARGRDVDLRHLVAWHVLASMQASFTSALPPKPSGIIEMLLNGLFRRLRLVHIQNLNPLYYWLFIHFRPSTKQVMALSRTALSRLDEIWMNEKSRALSNAVQEDAQDIAQAMALSYSRTANGKGINREEWCAMGRILYAASSDTTATTLDAILLVLALYQDVQQRVLDEIESVLGDEESPVLEDHLDRLEYMEMVIKETLRLFPAGPALPRRVREDIVVNGSLVPAGSVIIIHAFALHRNPEYFPDPLKFDPDRFSSEASKERPPYSYIPFSAGIRGCPGQLHAFVMIKLMLCHILKNFRILPGDKLKSLDDIKVKVSFTLYIGESSLRLVNRSPGKI